MILLNTFIKLLYKSLPESLNPTILLGIMGYSYVNRLLFSQKSKPERYILESGDSLHLEIILDYCQPGDVFLLLISYFFLYFLLIHQLSTCYPHCTLSPNPNIYSEILLAVREYPQRHFLGVRKSSLSAAAQLLFLTIGHF